MSKDVLGERNYTCDNIYEPLLKMCFKLMKAKQANKTEMKRKVQPYCVEALTLILCNPFSKMLQLKLALFKDGRVLTHLNLTKFP